MCVMLMGVFMVSCSSNSAANLQDILKEAKADGANWDAATWKKKLLEAADGMAKYMEPIKPLMKEVKELQEQAVKDPSKAEEIQKKGAEITAKLMEKSQEIEKDPAYKEANAAFEELMGLVQNNKTAAELENDKDFQKTFMEKIGMGGLE